MRLKELARELGLSPTTVSRALNGYSDVSETTRARVVDAAQRFGYHASSFASRLATGRSRTIGHVLPLARHLKIDPHFSDFMAGAGETYAARGYDMRISVVPPDGEMNMYRQMAASGSVDGVMVHGPGVEDARIDLLRSLDLPFIVHGRSESPAEGYDWLDVDNRRAFKRATGFLLDLGHWRIALLNGAETMNFAWRRRDGFEEAMRGRGLSADPELCFSDDMTEPNGHDWTRQLLALPDRPTAILASSMLLAMGALRAVREAGLEPARDVSILTYDDRLSFLENSRSVPYFTAARSSIRAAGKRCAEILIDRIEQPGGAIVNELWETELVVGSSTGPAPAYR